MLRHRGLYIYRLDPEVNAFRLASIRTPSCRVRPAYAGLVEDLCLSPVPLRLEAPVACRRWRECGEHWLELPVGDSVVLRFRLQPGQRLSPRRLERLTRQAGLA